MTQKPADGYPEIRLRKEGELTSMGLLGIVQFRELTYLVLLLLAKGARNLRKNLVRQKKKEE
jgi:hypothetical protein